MMQLLIIELFSNYLQKYKIINFSIYNLVISYRIMQLIIREFIYYLIIQNYLVLNYLQKYVIFNFGMIQFQKQNCLVNDQFIYLFVSYIELFSYYRYLQIYVIINL